MLRLAVVMIQPGPMEDYGENTPDQSGIEEGALFFDDLPYSQSYTQDKARNGKRDDPMPEEKNGKSGVKVKRAPKRQGSIAIDFDGTLTLDPAWFKNQIDTVTAQGSECHLVTSRPLSESGYVKDFCNLHGIKFASMNFYPGHYTYVKENWDVLMDVQLGAWKAKRIAELKADAVIDDNEIHISQIAKGNPGILILKPVGR
jgi:hypothetical protein